METLTAAEAAEIAGAPAAQLLRWAWDDWDSGQRRASGQVGPRNVGTRWKPRYRAADVVAWRSKYQGESRAVEPIRADV